MEEVMEIILINAEKTQAEQIICYLEDFKLMEEE